MRELLRGTEDKSISRRGVVDLPSKQISNIIFLLAKMDIRRRLAPIAFPTTETSVPIIDTT